MRKLSLNEVECLRLKRVHKASLFCGLRRQCDLDAHRAAHVAFEAARSAVIGISLLNDALHTNQCLS